MSVEEIVFWNASLQSLSLLRLEEPDILKLHMMSRFQGAVRLLVIFVGLHRWWALAVLAFVKKKRVVHIGYVMP